jgi:hypothetical protein
VIFFTFLLLLWRLPFAVSMAWEGMGMDAAGEIWVMVLENVLGLRVSA